MFSNGQKVECIADDWWHPLLHLIPALPVKGAFYHVRYTINSTSVGVEYITLAEIQNPPVILGAEPGFISLFFRLIEERKTDISVFTSMLTPAPKEKVTA